MTPQAWLSSASATVQSASRTQVARGSREAAGLSRLGRWPFNSAAGRDTSSAEPRERTITAAILPAQIAHPGSGREK
jgi:hypothetical protein